MNIQIINFGSLQYLQSVDLRYRILRKPLNLVFTQEFLLQDKYQHHIAAFDNKQLIGILLLKPIDNITFQMRQVAIDNNYQGKGIGKQLVIFAENFAVQKHISKIILHARQNAVNFYLKLGYNIIGDEFIEVTIPHYYMEKIL